MFFKRNKDKAKNSDTDPSSKASVERSLQTKVLLVLQKFFADKSEMSAQQTSLVSIERLNDSAIALKLGFVCELQNQALIEALKSNISELAQTNISIQYNVPIFSAKQPHLANVKNVIAVSSGKGGVGKSASAVNLALALSAQGARVGILDADIYGPSVPIMLGTENASPESQDNKHMQAIMAHGLASISIGYLVNNEHASIWRGPMASKALTQLAKETRWPLLDYLIVDMPPGTGDIQLTMAQQLPLTGAIVVTTPQDIALSDAQKGIAMFNKLDVPVLGLIENMSYFECPNCQHKTPIFSEHGAHRLAQKYHLPLLAQVPLNMIVRECADSGKSLISEHPNHAITQVYLNAAVKLSWQMLLSLEVSSQAKYAANAIDITKLD